MLLTPKQANDRQEELISSARNSGLLWLLMVEGGLANWQEEEDVIVPIWPNQEEASSCARSHFPGYEPVSIPLSEFLDDLAPQLIEQGVWAAANPTATLAGNQIPFDLLVGHLRPNDS